RTGFEGQLDVQRIDVAHWLGRPEEPSDVSGHIAFKIGFTLGDRFPRGTYNFHGSHASFRDYGADDVKVHVEVTKTEVLIGSGAVGSIDTSATPIHYSGEGDLRSVDLHRFGEGLQVGWLQEPKYAGGLSGHLTVDGEGSSVAQLRLTGGGRLEQVTLFGGR